jgi:hypothetical protein
VSTLSENFKSWYSDVLRSLYNNHNAGFVLLNNSLPLLERYTRQKLGLPANSDLQDPFYDELLNLLPELKTRGHARAFWSVYRNGLLHLATFSSETRKGIKLPAAWISHTFPSSLAIDSDGYFCLNPMLFAERVLKIIENDFATFERSTLTFPRAYANVPVTVVSGTLPYTGIVTGTALPQTFVSPDHPSLDDQVATGWPFIRSPR